MLNFKTVNYEAELLNTLRPVNKGVSFKVGESVKAEVIDILPSGGVVVKAKGQLLEVQSEIPLQKGTQLLLKVLNLDENSRLILKILSLSKNSENFKSIKNINIDIQTFNQIDNIAKLANIEHIKENFIHHWIFSGNQLREKILNSGVFFEKKLANSRNIKEDLKFKLYKLLDDLSLSKDEKKSIQDAINLINNYQNVSKEFNSLFVFLPVLLPDIKISQFLYKKISQNSKEGHFLAINLEFKDVGRIVISLFNVDKFLAITFFSKNEDFIKKLKKNIPHLKEELSKNFEVNFMFSNKLPDINSFLKKDENLINLKT